MIFHSWLHKGFQLLFCSYRICEGFFMVLRLPPIMCSFVPIYCLDQCVQQLQKMCLQAQESQQELRLSPLFCRHTWGTLSPSPSSSKAAVGWNTEVRHKAQSPHCWIKIKILTREIVVLEIIVKAFRNIVGMFTWIS